MSLPSDDAVKKYVGSWGEWMRSVGVSWDDATELEYFEDLEEEGICWNCEYCIELEDGTLWCKKHNHETFWMEPACEKFEPKDKEASE